MNAFSLRGIGCTGRLFLLFASVATASAFPVTDGSFELRPAGSVLGGTTTFTSVGVWTIDHGSYQSAQNGITPFQGTNMLRFDEVLPSLGSDIYQLVDVSSFSSQISTGGVTFTLSAYFNSPVAHSNALTMLAYFETSTPVPVSAFDGSTLPQSYVATDANPATWQQLTLNFKPPAGTHFIAVGLNSLVGGLSYADGVELTATVVPEPTVAALVLGAAGVCLRRRVWRMARSL